MSIEADNGGRRPSIPDSYASIGVPHCEDIWVDLAPADDRDLLSAAGITPPAQQFALLDIPAEDFFVCGGVCASCSGGLGTGLGGFSGPDKVRGGSRDNAKSVGLLVFAAAELVEALGALRLSVVPI